MTSKEFVAVLEKDAVPMTADTQGKFYKLEKDLELLEILKKYTTTQQHTHNVWFDNEYFINGKKCSEKEYEIVRESLENESKRVRH